MGYKLKGITAPFLMRNILIKLLAAIALPTAVNANLDPEIHKLWVPAADYFGCVKAMTT